MRQTTVKDWMKDLVVFIDPDASVYEGLELMRHRYATSLIVNKTDSKSSLWHCYLHQYLRQDRCPGE